MPTDTALLRVDVENRLSSPVGLQQVLFSRAVTPLVVVASGASAEVYRWSVAGSVLNAPLRVLRPESPGASTFVPWAEVLYSFRLSSSGPSDTAVTISLSLDAGGMLAASSSRPELLQISHIEVLGTPAGAPFPSPG
jgi:hypothetical protein